MRDLLARDVLEQGRPGVVDDVLQTPARVPGAPQHGYARAPAEVLHEVELGDGLGEMLLHQRQRALVLFVRARQRCDRILYLNALAHDPYSMILARLYDLGRAVREAEETGQLQTHRL